MYLWMCVFGSESGTQCVLASQLHSDYIIIFRFHASTTSVISVNRIALSFSLFLSFLFLQWFSFIFRIILNNMKLNYSTQTDTVNHIQSFNRMFPMSWMQDLWSYASENKAMLFPLPDAKFDHRMSIII